MMQGSEDEEEERKETGKRQTENDCREIGKDTRQAEGEGGKK